MIIMEFVIKFSMNKQNIMVKFMNCFNFFIGQIRKVKFKEIGFVYSEILIEQKIWK